MVFSQGQGQVMQLGLVTSLGQVIIVVILGSCADWLKLSQSFNSLLALNEEGSSSLLASLHLEVEIK